jgi:NADH dehydrogenase
VRGKGNKHRIVIIGGGFGGLRAARRLKRANVEIALIDRRNFHLFQPLLYQVATGALSPSDIATPLRLILRRQRNLRTIIGNVADIDPGRRIVRLENDEGEIKYDRLIVAAGGTHSYFGNEEWEKDAPGLKTVEDAVRIRRNILFALEQAEKEKDPEKAESLMTFVIVGAGPTGVELAGALAEMSNDMVRTDFRCLKPEKMRVVLVEGRDSVLPSFPDKLRRQAEAFLKELHVELKLNTMVSAIEGSRIGYKEEGGKKLLRAHTIIWAAGIRAAPLGKTIAKATGAETDKAGRIRVGRHFELENHPDIFVIGDLALYCHGRQEPLPQLAQAAKQAGEFVARVIRKRISGKETDRFEYRDRGIMAVIGRHRAVARILGLQTAGTAAWLLWLAVHLMQMIEYENRMLVLIQWAWNYLTRKRSARLITETAELENSDKYRIHGKFEGRDE